MRLLESGKIPAQRLTNYAHTIVTRILVLDSVYLNGNSAVLVAVRRTPSYEMVPQAETESILVGSVSLNMDRSKSVGRRHFDTDLHTILFETVKPMDMHIGEMYDL